MSRYRVLNIAGAALLLALGTHAQQSTPSAPAPAGNAASGHAAGLPSVEDQLKALAGKLSLTREQQEKIKPILQELHDATERLAEDKTLSQQERLDKIRPQREQADGKIRAVLDESQKEALDEYEKGPHPEMHGNLSGAAATPRQP